MQMLFQTLFGNEITSIFYLKYKYNLFGRKKHILLYICLTCFCVQDAGLKCLIKMLFQILFGNEIAFVFYLKYRYNLFGKKKHILLYMCLACFCVRDTGKERQQNAASCTLFTLINQHEQCSKLHCSGRTGSGSKLKMH